MTDGDRNGNSLRITDVSGLSDLRHRHELTRRSVFRCLSPKVWNVQAGHCLHDLREHTHVVEAIAFAPESANRSIATTSVAAGAPPGSGVSASALPDGAAALPPPPGGVPNGTAGGEGGGHEGALLTAGGGTAPGWRFLASGSRDKTVKLWNATVGQCLMTFVSVGVP